MYDQFYGFTGRPFQLTPDPAFYFESGTHRKAMSYLGYGLAQGEGFIVITGDVGAGKTTLVGHLMNTIDPSRLTAVKLVSTQVEGDDLLRLVAEQFGLEWEGQSKAEMLRSMEQFLREQAREGRRTLLIVDEGQNLSISALEELRMLSNFQLGGHSLLQIFLLGQPEFRQTLFHSPQLEQLRQRVIATHHLDPMEPEEVEPYILHRLGKVGWTGNPSFSPDAFEEIFDYSEGVPRKLNVLVSRILLFGAVEQLTRITGQHVRSVVSEVQADRGAEDVAAAPLIAPPVAAAPIAPATPAFVAPAAEFPAPVAAPFEAPVADPAQRFSLPAEAASLVDMAQSARSVSAAPEQPTFGGVAQPAAFTAPETPSFAAAPFAAPGAPPVAVPAAPAAPASQAESLQWPVKAANPVDPDLVTEDYSGLPPFAAPLTDAPASGLEKLAKFGVPDEADLLPPASDDIAFAEARTLVANQLGQAPAAVTAAETAPTPAPFQPAPFSIPAVPAAAAPFADHESALHDDALELTVAEVSPAPLAFGGVEAPVDGEHLVALQRQIAGLEARIVDQDAALRRVLDLLIDWVERDPSGAPDPSITRNWAA